ncbi:MAG: flavodoxin family protein [Methanosphaera sp.]|nr:flavodoxin family protein [Methanosphaera sp.]
MKILGISTSPRPGSNGKIALQNALEAAEAKGAETELINTAELKIGPCIGDNFCKANEGKCVIKDDMTQIYEKILEADGIILTTPIYFCDVTSQAKAVIDRFYAFFMQEAIAEKLSSKTISIIATNGVAPPEAIMPSLKVQAEGFKLLGFNIRDIITLGDNNEPEAINEKEDQLAKAKAVGENLVQ